MSDYTDPPDAGAEATRQHGGITAADRCAACNAPLAGDQRYCISCGERRGRPRFEVDSLASGATAPEPAALSSHAAAPRHAWLSSGSTLIAGVATLLVAMGVGVLIGHGNNSGTSGRAAPPAAAPVNVHISGGGGSAGATTRAKHARKQSSASTKPAKAPVSKKVAAKATQAAQKVTGGSAKVVAPTVKQGQSCGNSGASGCQGGKFTGNFFGGG